MANIGQPDLVSHFKISFFAKKFVCADVTTFDRLISTTSISRRIEDSLLCPGQERCKNYQGKIAICNLKAREHMFPRMGS